MRNFTFAGSGRSRDYQTAARRALRRGFTAAGAHRAAMAATGYMG